MVQTSANESGKVAVSIGEPASPSVATASRVLSRTGGSASSNPGRAKLALLSVGQKVVETGLHLLPSAFQAPAFSPDGEYVLLATVSGNGSSSLVLMTPAGGERSTLVELTGPVAFDWAPNGDHIAFIEGSKQTTSFSGNLNFIDISDPEEPVLIETEAENVIAFFWSPAGDQVAFFVPAILSDPANQNVTYTEETVIGLLLKIADAKDGIVRQVTSFLPSDNFLNILPFFDQYQRSSTIWSPDGNHLVLSTISTEDGTPGIYVVPSSGSLSPRFLVEGTFAFWSWD